MAKQYDELVTNDDPGDGSRGFRWQGFGPDYPQERNWYLVVPSAAGGAFTLQAADTAPDGEYFFVEDPGGGLHLKHTSGLYLGVDGEGNIVGRATADETTFIKPCTSAYGPGYVRFRIESAGTVQEIGAKLRPTDPDETVAVQANAPGTVGTLNDWTIDEWGAGWPTGEQRWAATWNPASRFSPSGFLHHVQSIVDHSDQQHGAPYWAGLSETKPGSSDTWGESIAQKTGAWLDDFASTDPAVLAAASMTLERASAHFYNAPGTGNELDPKVPPEWSGVDDELGSDPYPG